MGSLGVSQGSIHEKANDKYINFKLEDQIVFRCISFDLDCNLFAFQFYLTFHLFKFNFIIISSLYSVTNEFS